MKFFRASNKNVVIECQTYFGFIMTGMRREHQMYKIERKVRSLDNIFVRMALSRDDCVHTDVCFDCDVELNCCSLQLLLPLSSNLKIFAPPKSAFSLTLPNHPQFPQPYIPRKKACLFYLPFPFPHIP